MIYQAKKHVQIGSRQDQGEQQPFHKPDKKQHSLIKSSGSQCPACRGNRHKIGRGKSLHKLGQPVQLFSQGNPKTLVAVHQDREQKKIDHIKAHIPDLPIFKHCSKIGKQGGRQHQQKNAHKVGPFLLQSIKKEAAQKALHRLF